jgi:dTDP-4-amino-4,6-dideoxygalactose transaminase
MLCKTTEQRDETLIRLWENGVEARKFFSCLPTQEYEYGGSYPNAEDIGARGLFLPAHQGLTEEDIKKVVSFI